MSNSAIGQKDRPWRARISFQNGETTNPIQVGNVVCLMASNPSKVVRAATVGATASVLLAGIATKTAQPGEFLDVVVGGVAGGGNILLATRAATNANWPSYAAVNAGDKLGIDTSGMMTGGGAAAAGDYPYQLVVLGSVPSATTQGSSVGSGLTLSVSLPVLVRSLV